MREQELALIAAADELGGADEAVIVANVMQVMEANADPLQLGIYRILVSSAQAGVTAVSQVLPFNTAIGVDWTLPNKHAEQFALNYSYDLISRVQQTTRNGVRQALTRWIREGGTLSDLADSIRPLLVDEPSTRIIEALFSVDRATMIAETEATRAYARGKVEGYTASGLAQQAPNKIPPGHVRCRCDVRPESDPDGSWWWVWLTANDDRVCDICGPLHKQRVGLARPAPLSEGKAVAIAHTPIAVIEQSFVSRAQQHVAFYGANGRLLHTAKGTVRQVRIKADAKDLDGGTAVYNHPGGLAHSVAEVLAAHDHKLAEVRVVGITSEGSAWRHSIRPNDDLLAMDADKLADVVDAAWRATAADMVLEVLDGALLREQAANEFHHRLWLDVDARLKKDGRARLRYKREALYG